MSEKLTKEDRERLAEAVTQAIMIADVEDVLKIAEVTAEITMGMLKKLISDPSDDVEE